MMNILLIEIVKSFMNKLYFAKMEIMYDSTIYIYIYIYIYIGKIVAIFLLKK